MGWGGFLDKLLSKLPIQGRIERWKNELAKLQREEKDILSGPSNVSASNRLSVVRKRMSELQELLRNKVTD
jgi:hypothetical protein